MLESCDMAVLPRHSCDGMGYLDLFTEWDVVLGYIVLLLLQTWLLLLLQMLRQHARTHAREVSVCRPLLWAWSCARVLALEVCNGCLCLCVFGCFAVFCLVVGDSGLLECLTSTF